MNELEAGEDNADGNDHHGAASDRHVALEDLEFIVDPHLERGKIPEYKFCAAKVEPAAIRAAAK